MSLLSEKLGLTVDFNTWNRLKYETLEKLRDSLVSEYNLKINR